VALLQYPLRWPMPRQIAINDLLYWQNHTDPNGYFTGDSAYSIAWLALGNLREAAAQWNTSFSHMQPPFWVWRERVSGGHSNFLTGAGGFLQNLVFGYAGLQLSTDRLIVVPRLPPDTTGVILQRVQYLGAELSLSIEEESCTLTLVRGGSSPLGVYLEGVSEPHDLEPATPIILARSATSQLVFWVAVLGSW
jgi:protein-glucosylgalactosylhydroxylysine glucosidase